MKMPKHISTVLVVSMVAGSMSFNVVNADAKDESIVGTNRIDTAVKISQEGWKSADTAILVNDGAIPDALTATPLAHAKKAPVLLVNKKGISKELKAELKRLGTKNVIMIGGEGVLPSSIEKDLKEIGTKPQRISGANREETALEIAEEIGKTKDISKIAVVNGTNGLADAVSVAGAAAQNDMPILLSNPKKGLAESQKFIKDNNIKSTFAIGGTSVLSDKVLASLPGIERIQGSNRNDTNAKVIEKFYVGKRLDNMYVAKDGKKGSDQLIDALAVGALAAKNGAPVLIVSDKKLSTVQKEVINTKNVATITQVGGKGNEKALSEVKNIQKTEIIVVKTEAELQEALKKANANDKIEIAEDAKISNDIAISSNNAITIEIKGKLSGKVTVNTPNAEIKNSGTIGSLEIKNAKETEIVNTSTGKIDNIVVDSSSKGTEIENNGKISKIENNASGTEIKNKGEISKPVEGNKVPEIEGNKPSQNPQPVIKTEAGIALTGAQFNSEVQKLNNFSDITKVKFETNSSMDLKAMLAGENNKKEGTDYLQIGTPEKPILVLVKGDTLRIVSNEDIIKANPDSSYMFNGMNKEESDVNNAFKNVTTINTEKLDVSNVKNMKLMFANCNKLKNINVSNWNTSNSENMFGMFRECNSIEKLDVKNWKTGSVLSMSTMFYLCESLTTLDVSSWDVSKVGYMNSMFDQCTKIQKLDLTGWNTANVTQMKYMFNNCKALETLKVSDFKTGKVTDMESMFSNCNNLRNLDLSKWEVKSVKNMSGMFDRCGNLETIGDVSGWEVNAVEKMDYMFDQCTNMGILDTSKWDISNVNDMRQMFNNCNALTASLTIVKEATDCNYSMAFNSNSENLKIYYSGITEEGAQKIQKDAGNKIIIEPKATTEI